MSITTRYTLDNTAHCALSPRLPAANWPKLRLRCSSWPGPPAPRRRRQRRRLRVERSLITTLELGPLSSEHKREANESTLKNLFYKHFCEQCLTMVWIKRTEFRKATHYCPFLVLVGNNIVQLLSVCWPASDYLPEHWLVKVWCSDHAHVPMSRMERWRHRTATTGPCLHSSNFVSERRPESGAAPPRVFILSCCWPHRRLCYMLHVRARVARSRPAPGIYLGLLLATPATLLQAGKTNVHQWNQ